MIQSFFFIFFLNLEQHFQRGQCVSKHHNYWLELKGMTVNYVLRRFTMLQCWLTDHLNLVVYTRHTCIIPLFWCIKCFSILQLQVSPFIWLFMWLYMFSPKALVTSDVLIPHWNRRIWSPQLHLTRLRKERASAKESAFTLELYGKSKGSQGSRHVWWYWFEDSGLCSPLGWRCPIFAHLSHLTNKIEDHTKITWVKKKIIISFIKEKKKIQHQFALRENVITHLVTHSTNEPNLIDNWVQLD